MEHIIEDLQLHPGLALVACAVLCILLLCLLTLGRVRRFQRILEDRDGFDRLGGIMGRIEKMSNTLGELRAEVSREIVFQGNELQKIQEHIEIIRRAVTGKSLGERGGAAALRAHNVPSGSYSPAAPTQPAHEELFL